MDFKRLNIVSGILPKNDPIPRPGPSWIPSFQGGDSLSTIKAIFEESKVRTIFDVGANIGDITRQFHDAFPEAVIYTFEPSPDTFKALSARFSGDPRINLYDYAVMDKPGSVAFFCNRVSPTDSILSPSGESSQWVDGKEGSSLECINRAVVRSTDLDTFCREHGIEAIDILKIDTQGAEVHVLRGAKDSLEHRKVRVILAELLFVPVYENQPYFYQVCNFLSSYGYSLVNLFNIRLMRIYFR